MFWFQLFFTLVIIFAVFFALEIDPRKEFLDRFNKEEEKNSVLSLKDRINNKKGSIKFKSVQRLASDTKQILFATGKKDLFAKLCFFSVVLALVGIFLGLIIGNVFMSPALAIIFALCPFYWAQFSAQKHTKIINSELENALANITGSYLRSNEPFEIAVKENLGYIKEPLKSVFNDFMIKVTNVSPNMRKNLYELRDKIDNSLFHEWIDTILLCIEDRNMKSLLPNIITKFADERILNNELDTMIMVPLKGFFQMEAMVVALPLIFYMINDEWFNILWNTTPGRVICAVSLLVLVFTTVKVLSLIKPVEYNK